MTGALEPGAAPEVPAEVSDFLRDTVAPILSTHLGSVRVESVEDSKIRLRLTRSCGSCYFRAACIDGLLLPELEQRFGERYQFTIR